MGIQWWMLVILCSSWMAFSSPSLASIARTKSRVGQADPTLAHRSTREPCSGLKISTSTTGMVNKVAPFLRGMFPSNEWRMRKKLFQNLLNLMYGDQNITCLDSSNLDVIFKTLALSFPRPEILPSPFPETLDMVTPTPGRYLSLRRSIGSPTLASSERINAVVDGVSFQACQSFPSQVPYTVAFPPCAAFVCAYWGNPFNFQNYHISCCNNYVLGSNAALLAWYWPYYACDGADCPSW